MPKLGVKLSESFSPRLGEAYEIISVEEVTTQVRNLKGLRVTLRDSKGKENAEMLWLRDVVGRNSKLGAFIALLGDNTDRWVGKKIIFVSWMPRQRELGLPQ